MGKLRQMPALVAAAPSRLAPPPRDAHGHSEAAEPWRAWYRTARWKALRWATLLRDRFRCQWPGCGKLAASAGLVADHRKPHRGDERLFWDPDNLQTLCKACHDTHKQRSERRASWA